MSKGNRIRVIVVFLTIHLAILEWLLFELLRLPRHPPEDLGALLHHRQVAMILTSMKLLALGWLISVLCYSVSAGNPFSRRDVFNFAALLCFLAAGFMLITRYPWWPVAPVDLLFD